MTKEKKRKLLLTQFEKTVLGILGKSSRSLLSREITDQLGRGAKREPEPVAVLWALKRLEDLKLAEKGTNPMTWQLTAFGRKHQQVV